MATTTSDDVTLNNIVTFISDTGGSLKMSEKSLADAYKTLGPNSTPSDLLAFQAQLALNSTITSIYSALIKERSDTLKGICQKF